MGMSFETWMKRVDAALEAKVGLDSQCLADAPYRDEYDAGTTPAQMVPVVLEWNDWDMFA